MNYFGILSYRMPKGTEENNDKSVRIVGVTAEIRARHFGYGSQALSLLLDPTRPEGETRKNYVIRRLMICVSPHLLW
jgi:hypothetical protein